MVLQAIVTFLPVLLVLIVILRKSLEQSILSVYLPILLCVPLYDSLKLPALPPLNPATTAILPIGAWLLATKVRNLRFTRSDIWMAIFGISCGVALFKLMPSTTFGFASLFDFLTNCLIPYLVGKLLIEQEKLRLAFVKRLVYIVAILGVISVYEYRMGTNPFHFVWAKIFPDSVAVNFIGQIRWGFTRASGPLRQSEGTGMVFLVGTLMAYWLYRNNLWERKFRFIGHPFTKGALIFSAVCIGMFTCQARGPYLGVMLGLITARISKGKNLKRRMRYTLIFLIIGGAALYSYGKQYAAADTKIQTADQGDAVYRSQMIQNYWPVVQEGGIFGWGLKWPVQHHQLSIDNAFLFLALEQGFAGSGSFMLLLLEALLALSIAFKRMQRQQDVDFIFCIGGCILGEILSMGTVAIEQPVTQIIFLLVGWAQSIRGAEPVVDEVPLVSATRRYNFRRIFT
jgi:hypothetical protein